LRKNYVGLHRLWDYISSFFNKFNKVQKDFNQAVARKDEERAALLIQEVQAQWQETYPRRVRLLSQKFENTFHYDPFTGKEVAKVVKKKTSMPKHQTSLECEAQLVQLKKDNMQLHSQLSKEKLACLKPQIKITRESAQKVRDLQHRIRDLERQIQEGRKLGDQVKQCTMQLYELQNQAKKKTQDYKHAKVLQKRIGQLEKQLHDAQSEIQHAHRCNVQLEQLKPAFKGAQERATAEVGKLENQIKELREQLYFAQQQAQLASVCEKELKVAQSSLKETIEQLRDELT